MLTIATIAMAACASTPLRPPERQQDLLQTRAPSDPRKAPPKLVAPPPAYGNKVVEGRPPPPTEIAQRESTLQTTF